MPSPNISRQIQIREYGNYGWNYSSNVTINESLIPVKTALVILLIRRIVTSLLDLSRRFRARVFENNRQKGGHYSSLASVFFPSFNDSSRLLAFPPRGSSDHPSCQGSSNLSLPRYPPSFLASVLPSRWKLHPPQLEVDTVPRESIRTRVTSNFCAFERNFEISLSKFVAKKVVYLEKNQYALNIHM